MTFVWVHAWASTDVLRRDEYPGMTGMPRDGDPCSMPGCPIRFQAGEWAVAVIEVPREDRAVAAWGEAWCGYEHPTHRTWRDGKVENP